METFKLVISVDKEEVIAKWSGYGAQSAIAQAFLYYAQNGAKELHVLTVEETK